MAVTFGALVTCRVYTEYCQIWVLSSYLSKQPLFLTTVVQDPGPAGRVTWPIKLVCHVHDSQQPVNTTRDPSVAPATAAPPTDTAPERLPLHTASQMGKRGTPLMQRPLPEVSATDVLGRETPTLDGPILAGSGTGSFRAHQNPRLPAPGVALRTPGPPHEFRQTGAPRQGCNPAKAGGSRQGETVFARACFQGNRHFVKLSLGCTYTYVLGTVIM